MKAIETEDSELSEAIGYIWHKFNILVLFLFIIEFILSTENLLLSPICLIICN